MKSWLMIAEDSDFSIYNIPFGVFKTKSSTPRAASILGDQVIDLYALAQGGYLKDVLADAEVLNQKTLNAFIALGKPVTNAVRQQIQALFSEENAAQKDLLSVYLIPVADAEMLMPVHIPNYTDFYSSREHATNVGTMFRDPNNALLPNWLHLPVGYHGRASSIVVSGTPLHRPKGQTKADDQPLHQRLDLRAYWTLNWKLVLWLEKKRNWAIAFQPPMQKSIFLDCSCSMIGVHAMCRNGSMFRWDHSWQRISDLLYRHGLLHWKLWNRSEWLHPRKNQHRYLIYNLKDKKITTFN